MAKKTNTISSSPTSAVDEQKKRKKLARREARVMLEIQTTKSSIEKAEKRLAKAQALLEIRNAHLRTLKENLAELRTSHEEPEVNTPDNGFDHQSGQPELVEKNEVSTPDEVNGHQSEQPELVEEIVSSSQQEAITSNHQL